jgi:ubiquinone/menaquinone biosynthesis C-methylase UbiE
VGGDVGFNLYDLAGLGVDCVDIDICPGCAEFVCTVAKFYGLSIPALRGDTCDLPFADGSFDAVYSKDTFEHIWDCDQALREQVRVIKKGGKLCIIVGNLVSPKMLFEMLIRSVVKSRGKRGGLRWLFTKNRVYSDFGIGWHGKGEDVKTTWWWRKKLESIGNLDIVTLTTTRAYKNPKSILARLFEPIAGSIIILAVKK